MLIPPVTLQERVDGVLRPWRDMSFQSDDALQVLQMRDGSFQHDAPIEAMKTIFNVHFSIVSQVNPHIVPFFYSPQGSAGRPIGWPWRNFRGGFISYLVEVWLKEDLQKNLSFLQKTGLLFNVFGVDWSYLFLQREQGDVTILPDVSLWDY